MLLATSGCEERQVQIAPLPPPMVTISQPIEREISDEAVFTGHTDAIKTVEIRARVSGFIDRVAFEDGAMVKEGDLLFQIDPRPFDAEVAHDEASLEMAKARAKRAAADLVRAEKLIKGKTITQEDYDKAIADAAESSAAVAQVAASLDSAKLNREFSTVTAPISGRVSRAMIAKGNLVNALAGSATLLTAIVPLDPIYAYFDVDEPILLHYSRTAGSQGRPMIPLEMQLADESGFSHQGAVDFIDNKVDPATGTIRLRGAFPNPDGRILPGMFVRVRIRSAEKHAGLLVTDRAVGIDQGRKYLLVATADDKADYREVVTGPLVDGLRVIEQGLKPGEWVIVNGLQRARPGNPVKAEKAPMPLPPGEAEPPPAEAKQEAAD
ncbi:MAG TPA: efflux RND transporter periplasmic adaptor subunit [Pirellulales bacterium]|nr:efflux RND transporter periplasmic adaptor subunit [Pirellulales bacterium]